VSEGVSEGGREHGGERERERERVARRNLPGKWRIGINCLKVMARPKSKKTLLTNISKREQGITDLSQCLLMIARGTRARLADRRWIHSGPC
jgi:hypothetical protein